MKTIKQSELLALQLALKHVNPLLMPILERIVDQGALMPPPPTHKGAKPEGKFVQTVSIPVTEAKAVSEAFESFYQSENAWDVRFNEMTILGVIYVWTYLIC